MNPKELIVKIKEYADIADASYALLHSIEEKEEAESWFDEKLNLIRKPPARWIYADGIKRGYEVKEANLSNKARANHRSLGQPTAYALGIEARFAKDKLIKLDENETPKKIDNTIQNFIKRSEDNPSLEDQEIKVSTTKEKMIKEKTSHYLSYRTKTFTSRYELLHHQKNTSLGYSASLFLDTWARCEEEKYILAFRGTETGSLKNFWQDVIRTDGSLAVDLHNEVLGVIFRLKREECFKQKDSAEYKALTKVNPQVISLLEHREVVFEIMRKLTKKEDFKLNLAGHSLGGNLAQAFCLVTEDKYISSLYTYNAPGFGGAFISRMGVFTRVIGIINVLTKKPNKKLEDNNGMTRKTIDRSIEYCDPKESLEDYIRYEKELQQAGGSKVIKENAKKSQQLSKAKSEIDIHHIETISQPIPLNDAFQRKKVQEEESAPSIIADLGFYKYGLPFEIQENEKDLKVIKYELANTDKLHLLHIGGLKGFFDSHYMESILQITYFYDYLLKQKDNQNKQVFCGEIADGFNYLASYTQILIDLISCNKLLQYKNDKSYLLAYLKEIFYVLKNKKSYLDKKVEISFGESQETIDITDFEEIDSNNLYDGFRVLDAYKVYTKMIDKNDAKELGE